MRFRRVWAVFLLAFLPFFQGRCAPADSAALPGHNLTLEQARARSRAIENVSYDLSLKLDGDKPTFTGSITVSFTLKENDQPVFMDFYDGDIKTVSVNGKAAEVRYDGAFLALPANALKTGTNAVNIDFEHAYSDDGSGLYRFRDPEDRRIYLYTDFEPYNANLVFPCFDQPDLKAAFAVSVEAPESWQVVSSGAETSSTTPSKGIKRRVFARTPPISPYAFAVHAGEYRVWQDFADGIPIRLLARQSLARHVDAAVWLDITKKGLAFYRDYFGTPYPFGKYDQIIVPDFNAGAMENVAAVSVSERYVYRDAPTPDQALDRADTILHEMAHMWFGNLVTMRWWNGLWLNESFASFSSAIALEKAMDEKLSWLSFFNLWKVPALVEDRLPTAHPVEADVPDTAQAFANFDDITYGKGASALQQLRVRLGDEAFRKGLKAYFEKHRFANADLGDFLAALGATAKLDLSAWSREWLEKAGTDAVQAEYACRDGKISSFGLRLTPPAAFPARREHSARVALYAVENGLLRRTAMADADLRPGLNGIPALAGLACPDLVDPDADGADFVKIVPDPRTLENFAAVTKIADPLARRRFRHALWEFAKDGGLTPAEYVDKVLAGTAEEKDFVVAQAAVLTLLQPALGVRGFLEYLPGTEAAAVRRRCESVFWERFQSADPGSDLQKLWLDSFAAVATPSAASRLAGLLDGTLKAPGLSPDPDRRWRLIVKLNELAAPGAGELAEAEKSRDPGDRGRDAFIAAQAARPGAAGKKMWMDKILSDDPGLSQSELVAAIEHLFPPAQRDLRERSAPAFFAGLKKLKGKNDEFLEAYVKNLHPGFCGADGETGKFLRENPEAPAILKKLLTIAAWEGELCRKLRLR